MIRVAKDGNESRRFEETVGKAGDREAKDVATQYLSALAASIESEMSAPQKPKQGDPKKLIAALAEMSTEHTRMTLSFANVKQKPLSEQIVAAFTEAGWISDMTNVPWENYRHEYVTGTMVRGFNKSLLTSVSDALSDFGCAGVYVDVDELKVQRSNPKWSDCYNTVKIHIGHQD